MSGFTGLGFWLRDFQRGFSKVFNHFKMKVVQTTVMFRGASAALISSIRSWEILIMLLSVAEAFIPPCFTSLEVFGAELHETSSNLVSGMCPCSKQGVGTR